MGPKDDDDDLEDDRAAPTRRDREPRDATRDSGPTMSGPLRGRPHRPSAPLRVGGERYQIGEAIAKGGMGEIVTAHDLQIGRDVAIKRLIGHDLDDSDLERFLREARIQGRLDHPAIVPVYELARDHEGRPYFAMKRLSGRTMADVLEDHHRGKAATIERFSRQRLLRAFADVCLAIEFAHNHGVIHRDLKPTNIMLGDFGEVYVIDWGIARIVGERDHTPRAPRALTAPPEDGMTVPGTQLGTPGYMPPEQISGEEDLDSRADVYALGCILYEILAGRALHPGGAPGLISALEEPDARPSARAPDRDVPPELDVLCVEATRGDRERRLQTARELGERVQRFLDGDRDLARRRELAREHLVRATAALAAAGEADDERTARALREAGRALVLDPTSSAAADMVGRLVLEPPRTTPPEVDREIANENAARYTHFARQAALGYLGYLVFVPMIFAMGVRDYRYLVAMVGVVAVHTLIAWLTIARGWRTRWRTVAVVAVHATMAALMTRMFGLPLVAPGAVAVTLMAFMAHPAITSGRDALIASTVVILAMLAPFIVESAGLASRTLIVADDVITIRSAAVHQQSGPSEAAFVTCAILMVVIATVMAWLTARRERATRYLLRIQAWRLRQLVPDAPAR